jgi:hypothetical protein
MRIPNYQQQSKRKGKSKKQIRIIKRKTHK